MRERKAESSARTRLRSEWIRRMGLLGVALGLTGASGSVPHAELDRADLLESYSGQAEVSGGELVGLLLGRPAETIERPFVNLVSPQPGTAVRVCVRVITRDGLFWSDNPFRSPPTDNARIQAGPVAEVHRDAFLAYRPDEVMVRAAVPASANCADLGEVAVYSPAIGNPDGSLRVYLNTRGRAAGARLRRSGDSAETLASTRCHGFETGPAVAADRICRLDLPPTITAGTYELHVRILDAVGSEDRYFTVRIPDAR